MKIFPNPATPKQHITVLLDDEISGSVVLDVHAESGECVYHDVFYKVSSEYMHNVNLEGMARGIYVLRITNGTKTGTQKLIIQ